MNFVTSLIVELVLSISNMIKNIEIESNMTRTLSIAEISELFSRINMVIIN